MAKRVENQCVARECPAACCHNVTLYMDEKQYLKFTRGFSVKEVTEDTLRIVELLAGVGSGGFGLYHAVIQTMRGERNAVHVRGSCPHLEAGNNCTIYRKPARPNACSKLLIGTTGCTKARERIGLPPLDEL